MFIVQVLKDTKLFQLVEFYLKDSLQSAKHYTGNTRGRDSEQSLLLYVMILKSFVLVCNLKSISTTGAPMIALENGLEKKGFM